MTGQGSAALCRKSNGPRVRSMPHSACVQWERAPGTDDEHWPPMAADARPAVWTAQDGAAVAAARPGPAAGALGTVDAASTPGLDCTGAAQCRRES